MVGMQYRGFTSVYGYCAHRAHQKGTRCPSLRFAFDNVLAPNNSAKSKKMCWGLLHLAGLIWNLMRT